jgi:hypothetical protein
LARRVDLAVELSCARGSPPRWIGDHASVDQFTRISDSFTEWTVDRVGGAETKRVFAIDTSHGAMPEEAPAGIIFSRRSLWVDACFAAFEPA